MSSRTDAIQHYNAGCDLLEGSHYAKAQVEFEAALDCDREFYEALLNARNCLLNLNRPAEAIPYYLQALNLQPDNALSHFNYGWALYILDRYDEAADELLITSRLDSSDAEKILTCARFLATAGRAWLAFAYALRAIKSKPFRFECYHALSDVVLLGVLNVAISASKKYRSGRKGPL